MLGLRHFGQHAWLRHCAMILRIADYLVQSFGRISFVRWLLGHTITISSSLILSLFIHRLHQGIERS